MLVIEFYTITFPCPIQRQNKKASVPIHPRAETPRPTEVTCPYHLSLNIRIVLALLEDCCSERGEEEIEHESEQGRVGRGIRRWKIVGPRRSKRTLSIMSLTPVDRAIAETDYTFRKEDLEV